MQYIRPAGRRSTAPMAVVAALVILLAGGHAEAQSLKVLPVNIQMAPGQNAATLTVINQGDVETTVQVRAYAWNQQDGNDELTSSNQVVVSPPLASIAPGADQVIRLILRRPPEGKEETYRVILDQIPPPAVPGVVRIVLRMSIPIFAQPATRALAHMQFHVESGAGHVYLVGLNDGSHHESIRDITLWTTDGHKLSTGSSSSPYILGGSTRRWPISTSDPLPPQGETMLLTARSDGGVIEQQVRVVGTP